DTQRVEHASHVIAKMLQVVALDIFGSIGESVAPLIRSDRPKARFAQRLDLVPPGECEFGKTMTENHGRAIALLVDRHANSVRLYELGSWHMRRRANLRLLG